MPATVATGIRVPEGRRRLPHPTAPCAKRRGGDRRAGAAILQAVEDAARDDGFLLLPGRRRGACGVARRWSVAGRARTSACCCSTAPTATNIRCPTGRSGWSWTGAEPAHALTHIKVNPGNRSLPGLHASFLFRFAKHTRTIAEACGCSSLNSAASAKKLGGIGGRTRCTTLRNSPDRSRKSPDTLARDGAPMPQFH